MPDFDSDQEACHEQELHVNRERPVDIRPLLLAVFVLVGIGIATAGSIFYLEREESLAERALDQLSSIAVLKVREIAEWRGQQLDNARALVRNPFTARAVRDYLARPEESNLGREVEAWMDDFRESYGYRNVLLLDRTGAVRASVPDSVPTDPSVLEQVLESPPKSGPFFFDFHRAGGNGEVMLNLYTAVADPDRPGGEPLGFFVLKIDPEEFLYPFIQLWPTPSETAETLLVERQGDEVLFLNDLRHRQGTALTLRRPITETTLPATYAAKGLSGTMEGLDYRGERVFSAYHPVTGSTWALVAKVDKREALSDLLQDSVLLGSLVAALLVASGAILLYIETRQASRVYRERQAAMDEKERMLMQLDAVLNNIVEGVAISDLNGNVITMNQAALDMHGFESLDQGRQHLHRFQEDLELSELDGRVVPVEQWPLSRVLLGDRFTDREVRLLHRKTGKRRIASYNGTSVRGRSGEAILAVVTLRDITDRKRAEEETKRLNADLESANRELEAFNYTIAHDLRKPLTVVSGYTQVIRELCTGNLDEQCMGYLQEAYDGTLRMNRLIDVLLNFSSLARAELHREKVDLSAMVRAAAAELQLADPVRRVEFKIAEGIFVDGDADLLGVVLANLLGNAWKYTVMREEAVIEFGVTEIDGEPACFARDNGTGFDMKEAEKLFVPFERLLGTRDFTGFGIGLATVERIIHRHGGRVWAEGDPGKGATFYFTLGQS